jgi:hypothetical protein
MSSAAVTLPVRDGQDGKAIVNGMSGHRADIRADAAPLAQAALRRLDPGDGSGTAARDDQTAADR